MLDVSISIMDLLHSSNKLKDVFSKPSLCGTIAVNKRRYNSGNRITAFISLFYGVRCVSLLVHK